MHLLSDSDAMRFDEKQLASVVFAFGMIGKVGQQSNNRSGNARGLVLYLQSDDASVVRGWIIDNVGEVAVERNQDRIESLSAGNHLGVERIGRNVIAQNLQLIAWLTKRIADSARYALIDEEAQAHTTRYSAKSRA